MFYVRKPRRVNKVVKLRLKVIVVGEKAVGKSSLVRRYVHDRFTLQYEETLGTKVYRRVLQFHLPERHLDVNADLLIWDLTGDIAGDWPLRGVALHGAHGIIVVCDASRGETLNAVRQWLDGALAFNPRAPVRVVVNKWDHRGRNVDYDDLENHAREKGIPHVPASARTGANVERVFQEVVERAIRQQFLLPVDGRSELSRDRGAWEQPSEAPDLPPQETPAARPAPLNG